MGLDLEAGPFTSPSTSQSAALPSVQTTLGQRILRGEYVNLDKFLPENLSKQPKEQICWLAGADTHAPLTVSLSDTTARRKIVDMLSWVQAFTNYAATVLRWAPERAAELMGYQALISQAFQNFQNPAVLAYDREFRALISQSAGCRLDELDTTLWAMKFTSQTRSSCLSLHDSPQPRSLFSAVVSWARRQSWRLPERLKFRQSRAAAAAATQSTRGHDHPNGCISHKCDQRAVS